MVNIKIIYKPVTNKIFLLYIDFTTKPNITYKY